MVTQAHLEVLCACVDLRHGVAGKPRRTMNSRHPRPGQPSGAGIILVAERADMASLRSPAGRKARSRKIACHRRGDPR